MSKDPFVRLGVTDSVTQNELYEAYKAERRKWEGKRFAPGEEGEYACEQLDEIETAYREADEILRSRYYVTETPDEKLKKVDEHLKSGRYSEAERLLNECTEHNARWHFLYSIVCHAKKSDDEAVEHLRMAVNLEPTNDEYREALNKLESRVNANRRSYREGYNPYADMGDGRSYRDDVRPARGVTPCDCCSSLLCADCCCECMGGDLITCC